MNIEHLITALSLLPRLPYQEWITILSGLAAEFGVETAYNIALAAGFKDEQRNETLYKLHHRLQNITFGSVIHILREYRIRTTDIFQHSTNVFPRQISKPFTTSSIPQSYREPELYCFADDEAEERAGIYQFDGNMTRIKAEQRVIAEFSNVQYERAYRCAWSDQSRNKDISIRAGSPQAQWSKYIKTFIHKAFTVNELIACIRSGYAILPCLIRGKKAQEHWVGSEMLFVDIDETMTLEAALQLDITHTCLFLHTTHRHRKNGLGDRFRIVFALQGFERRAEVYRAILTRCISMFKADATCSDITKSYFGNTEAQVWTPKGGWIYA